jgi:ribosomal protein S12 methylthiotransferase
LVNRHGEELRKEIPAVDFWAGSEEWDEVLHFLGSPSPTAWVRGLLAETRIWSRYLKVSEGCDANCAYCAIPSIRGRARSVPMERLIEESAALCEQGAREICLVGQDPTLYGSDLYGRPRFRELLRELDRTVPKDTWLRLLYLHPNRVDREFIDWILESASILPYLDIPIQHIDETVLAAMNRRGSASHIREIFSYAREADPRFALRTTLMTGFPGETESQFGELLSFLEDMRVDRAGCFMFSPEEGTPAAEMPNQVPDAVKERRYDRLMRLQAGLSRERGLEFKGEELLVLVDEIDESGVRGRSFRDAPEVDGQVIVRGAKKARPGSFIRVRVEGADEYDLHAKMSGRDPN